MSNRLETLRLTPEALSEGLTAAGISLSEFCHLFDVRKDQARRWMLPDTHPKACEPPFWVTQALAACANPGQLYDFRHIRSENTPQPEESTHAA